MRRLIPLLPLASALVLMIFGASGQDTSDRVVFDEDDALGVGYYDASVGHVDRPSTLELGGPGDKLLILTNRSFTGRESGLLQWQSAPNGKWKLLLAQPGFRRVNAAGYSNLVLHLNGPNSIAATELPRIGLESSPPDVESHAVPLGNFLPDGLDADPSTWQQVSIPLSAFALRPGFALSRVKGVVLAQGTPDNASHTLWLDAIRFGVTASTTPLPTCPPAPTAVLACAGDRSVVLHWDQEISSGVESYKVYRRVEDQPWQALNHALLRIQSYADVNATNGQTYSYSVRSLSPTGQESPASMTVSATPASFRDNNDFLDYLQQTAFDYFWYEANPSNGLIRDRSDPAFPCSTAAVGFGLTAIGIGVDHGWITRSQGAARTERTLRTLWERPQGPEPTGRVGYKGWFYHFLDMDSGLRFGSAEVSSIDTALLLAGVLQARQCFDGPAVQEKTIRALADNIYNRVDWQWMAQGSHSLAHGWRPETGFIAHRWGGYTEGMLLYLLGMGARTHPLPAAYWEEWTSKYLWQTNYHQSYVQFPPLFGHQYTHCWVDFRSSADAYMRAKGLDYFENSRRATLAQREYCMANPGHFTGYSSNVWGLTACDGPGVPPYLPYAARGGPAPLIDDGTIAPTAVAGSLAFAPEYALPALRFMYDQYLPRIWTGYGFRDAFNLQAKWWGPHVIGIDQGPILIMAENYRSGHVWQRFMQCPEIQRGLITAGFTAANLPPHQPN